MTPSVYSVFTICCYKLVPDQFLIRFADVSDLENFHDFRPRKENSMETQAELNMGGRISLKSGTPELKVITAEDWLKSISVTMKGAWGDVFFVAPACAMQNLKMKSVRAS